MLLDFVLTIYKDTFWMLYFFFKFDILTSFDILNDLKQLAEQSEVHNEMNDTRQNSSEKKECLA